MFKKEKKLSVTDEINNKAKEIMKQEEKTSLEAKRLEFCNFLDDYYEKLSGSSELLVTRKEEINFYTTTSKDFYSSILISLLTSTIISFSFWFFDKAEKLSDITKNDSFIVRLILFSFLSICTILFVRYLFKLLINSHNERKNLSDYEKLNLKEYEIEIIDRILKQRFENYKTEIGNKNNVCNKTGGKNETEI